MPPAKSRDKSLRERLSQTLLKHVGATSFESLSEAQRRVLTVEVDTLVHSAVISPADIVTSAKRVRSTVDGAQPGAQAAAPITPQPPSILPPHQRKMAGRLQDKLERDARWLTIVEDDKRKFEEEQRSRQRALLDKRESQRTTLEEQMKEREQLKSIETKVLRDDANRVIQQCSKELDEERREKEAARRKIVEERERRESIMRAHEEEKRIEKQRKVDDERNFLAQLNEAEERSRREERIRRAEAKRELRSYLDENMRQEEAKRANLDTIRERERIEIEKARGIQRQREEAAKAVALRQTERGLSQTRRQEVILEKYQQQRIALEEELQEEERRRTADEAARIKREAEELENRKQRASRQKVELVEALARQVDEHKQSKAAKLAEEAKFKRSVEEALQAGTANARELKELERRRKFEFKRELDVQSTLQAARNRQELQTKIP